MIGKPITIVLDMDSIITHEKVFQPRWMRNIEEAINLDKAGFAEALSKGSVVFVPEGDGLRMEKK